MSNQANISDLQKKIRTLESALENLIIANKTQGEIISLLGEAFIELKEMIEEDEQ